MQETNIPGALAHHEGLKAEDTSIPADDDERRAWQAALLAAPAGVQETLPKFAEEAAPPKAWRSADASLTDRLLEQLRTAPETSPTAGQGVGELAIARFASSVETPEIGKVHFVVDRSDAGVRIVVELENPLGTEAIERERLGLLGALRAAGLNVLSFRILVRGNPGIRLAQDRTTPNGSPSSIPFAGSKPDEDEDDPNRLVVVG